MIPAKTDFVKFSIDGVLLRDVERFDALAKEVFPDSPNPRKKLFYNFLWLARAIRELSATKHGEENDGPEES
jgi:hypothetical protein